MFLTSDFDFDLPANLIAQEPFFPKEKTKMLVAKDGQIFDLQLLQLLDFLQAGDLLVFNDAKVIKAKLSAKILRNSAILDFNLDQEIDGQGKDIWQALCRPAKKVMVGDVLEIAPNFLAEVLAKSDDGFIKIKFNFSGNKLLQKLDKYGSTPLPPYIKREKGVRPLLENDAANYQTIYAKNGTAVAAPTAGLHFNENIFSLLEEKKVNKAFITLNVGAGTFLPVRADNIKDHKMHSEFFSISKETAELINETKAKNKKVIAVGTTSLRALESAATKHNFVASGNFNTNIFIYPPYDFKIVDILMTNFHLPKSTLFMLICAFVGKDRAFEIYNHAIKNNYRFYSYGDTSLLFKL
jgi:S-adenosylmethionine:tRNA ribosyltransferase-isomerase